MKPEQEATITVNSINERIIESIGELDRTRVTAPLKN